MKITCKKDKDMNSTYSWKCVFSDGEVAKATIFKGNYNIWYFYTHGGINLHIQKGTFETLKYAKMFLQDLAQKHESSLQAQTDPEIQNNQMYCLIDADDRSEYICGKCLKTKTIEEGMYFYDVIDEECWACEAQAELDTLKEGDYQDRELHKYYTQC